MRDVQIRNPYNQDISPTQPFPVDTVEAQKLTAISETLTYNGKAAAGAISINSTQQKAIVSIEGDRVASFWGAGKNRVYFAKVDSQEKSASEPRLTSIVEANGSASITIYDENKNLENLFESLTTTVKRFVARVKDKNGLVLYGWIFGVAASGNTYMLDIVNNRLTETRNWVGDIGSFDSTNLVEVEIFRYNSSLAFGTGTTLTEEVAPARDYGDSWEELLAYANNLTNGQYFVDYMRGLIIGKKADNTASESIAYNIWANSASLDSSESGTGYTIITNPELTLYQGQALDSGEVILNGSGHLHSVTALISNSAATDEYYLQGADANAIPADGAVTHLFTPIEIDHTNLAQSIGQINFAVPGITITTGIAIWISTTELTKTIAGNVAILSAEYRTD